MAGANLPAKKYQKTSPTVTRLSFEFDGGSTQFIDIGEALSKINRKFYRAGVYYYVNSVEIYNDETGVVDLHTAPDNWVTKNAWNRGFQIFQKMNRLVGPPLTSGVTPKYHDFKVYLNNRHRTTGTTSPSLYDINSQATPFSNGEWVYSVFSSADDDQNGSGNSDEFTAHLLGAHQGVDNNWDSIGLIKSYAESRARPATPSPTVDGNLSTDPLVNIFDFSQEEQMNAILTNLDEDNDEPPYNAGTYVGEGGHMQHVARIGTEVGVGRVGRASGFCAPFGLICVDPYGVNTAFRVVLNLAVGTYHGVYAERA
ncbi:MAG: hypothetical protein [Circular genetic element sp.]|nr:MAG: hypothetical protein [Circular genetic element sp.]